MRCTRVHERIGTMRHEQVPMADLIQMGTPWMVWAPPFPGVGNLRSELAFFNFGFARDLKTTKVFNGICPLRVKSQGVLPKSDF